MEGKTLNGIGGRDMVKPVFDVPGPKTPADKDRAEVFVSQVRLDANKPIPFEGGNFFSYESKSAYIPFLNPKDNFGQILLEARLLSPTHSACIDTKSDFCAGDDMVNEEGTTEIDVASRAFLDSMNLKNESIGEINKQIFESFFLYGNTPIELVRFNVGEAGPRFYVYVHNFLEWRLVVPNVDDICVEAVYSKSFSKQNGRYLTGKDLKKAKRLPIYNPRNTEKENWRKDENGDTERTLIWYKNSMAGYNYYGMPSSVACLPYQIAEYKEIRFNLDGFDNNWIASVIIALKGNVSPDENRRIAREIIDTHTGDGKRGRAVVLSSMSGEGMAGTEITQLETSQEGSFLAAAEAWSQKIIFSNGWDSVLAGLLNASTLGKGAGFITKIFEIKQTTVILPAQKHLIKNVWNNVFKEAAAWLKIPINTYKLKIKTSANINALADVDVTPVVTVDEVREANNLPKLNGTEGGKLVGSMAAKQTTQTDNTKPADNVQSK